MKKIHSLLVISCFLSTAIMVSSCDDNIIKPNPTETKITSLKTNSANNPLGLDALPSFSWNMESNERGQKQTAYQIKVSSTYEKLTNGEADVWDSGKVDKSTSISVPYQGDRNLDKTTAYFWKVSVWDKDNVKIDSDIASFETGLGTNGFDDAKFIVANKTSKKPILGSLSFSDANWIWNLNGRNSSSAAAETQFFRYSFKTNEEKSVKSAKILFTADDYGTIYFNEHLLKSGSVISDIWKKPSLIDISEYVVNGDNLIAAEITNFSAGYAGFICKLEIMYTDNSKETIITNDDWKLSKTHNDNYYKFDFDDSNWSQPDQNIVYGAKNSGWGTNAESTVRALKNADNAPMFRREFNLEKTDIESARIYATSAGVYDLYFNGEKSSNAFLTPSWTEYNKHLMYQTYDVTEQVKNGSNVIGAQLGNGWYAGRIGNYGQIPAFLCKMVITYKDGSKQTIVSDENWKVYTEGPVIYNDLFDGEHYDNRLYPTGWSEPNYSENDNWLNALSINKNDLKIGEIIAQIGPNIQVMDQLTAKSVNQIASDTYIYDFGQNFAGVPLLTFTGEKDLKIRIRYAEMLNDASNTGDGSIGTLYTKGLRSAKATDYYIFGSNEKETWMPSLTYHGFRYLEIKGLSKALPLNDVKGLVTYSGLENTASFETSEPLINQLCSNAYWSQRSNFLGVPTDCPQRDERAGWTGDTQIFFGTASYFMNTKEFYLKALMDINDNQRSNGAYNDVAPGGFTSVFQNSGHNGWGDSAIIIPYLLFYRYGDASPIEKYWSNMNKYIKYLVNDSTNFIRNNDPNGYYGDWLSVGESTPLDLCNTAFCVYVCDLMVEMGSIIGKDQTEIDVYREYANNYREAWCHKFLNEDGSTKCSTQTSYVLGLKFNIIPDNLKAASADKLAENIVSRGNKLTTGFMGVSYLMPVLCQYGHTDVAFALLEQEEYPSWLYPVLQGATTIWERWNSYTIENGFGDANMNSFNHYSYGSIMEWAFSTILGISEDRTSADNVGLKHFILRPTKGGQMTYAKGFYQSAYGKIESAWSYENEKFSYSCSIPANSTATL